MEIEEKIFKTKKGYCHILSDKIVLSRRGSSKHLAKIKPKELIGKRITAFVVAGVAFTAAGIVQLILGKNITPWFFLTGGVVFFFAAYKNREYSTVPVIDRAQIKEVQVMSKAGGVYFLVSFENESGQVRKKPIMVANLPKENLEESMRIMKEEGYIL